MDNIKFCETCGKEHDGSYGSGRFCSYNCKQKFSSIKGAAKSAYIAKEKFGIKCSCEFCGKEFLSKVDLKKHKSICDSKPKKEWKCKYCESSFKTRRLLQEHNKQNHFVGEHLNQFTKAKLLGLPVPEGTNKGKRGFWYGKHLTEDQKKKISESRKKYLDEHPDKVPFKLNHSSKESYPEKYFREWLQKENIFSEREYQVGLYTLEFAWPERKIYLEIDGSQHHLDWMIKHDEERTKKLSELGWVCVQRIYWPDYQKLNLEERKSFLLKLKEKIL